MAPHMQRVCHGIGDPGRYPLRTLKHSENFLRLRNVDVSKINGKEGFFHCIGLQMKRFQYQYKTLNGSCNIRTINIPNGVMLRECSVVILGTTCRLCGQCFKCKTDLNIHIALTHQTYSKIHGTAVKATQCTEDKNEMYNKITKSFEHTIFTEKNLVTKLRKKLRLTLKIGEEIVAKISMKRKHLKVNTANRCTQTEQYSDAKLSIHKDAYESVISDIDPPVFCNSPYQCCNSSMNVVNSPNQYAVSNIVANEQAACEETIAYEENHVPFRLNESRTKLRNEKCGAACNDPLNTVLPESNIVPTIEKDNLHHSNFKKANLIFNGTCSNSVLTETPKSVSCFNEKPDSIKSSINSADFSSGQIEQCHRNEKVNERNKNVSVNETQSGINTHAKNKCASEKQSQPVPNMLQVIIPVILPIVVSNNKTISNPSPVKLTIQPATVQQEQEQKVQQTEKTYTVDVEDHSDEEVQEVLRIIRGRSISSDINHESPNRVEQEMLLQDAIKDMKRMEDQGWHLLEKNNATPTRKKKRTNTSTKSNAKNNETNDERAKKKQKISVQENSVCNVVRESVGEKCISGEKEQISEVPNNNMTTCQLENVNESLTTCTGNVDVSIENLHRYGINYCNEVFEVNNNTTKGVQKPVSPFHVPCSGGTENRSNRPAIIDLVNDTDE